MQPFDLDALVSEQEAEPFAFTWGGRQFLLPRMLDMSLQRQLAILDKVETLQAGADPKELVSILELVIGPELLEELSAARALSARAVMGLIQAWQAAQGDALGKSPASSDSSANGARPSKPTSHSGPGRRTS